MKAERLERAIAYAGGWTGIIIYLFLGLVPSAFVGGYAGLNIAGLFFSFPLDSTLPVKIIVAASMLLGMLISCGIFVMGMILIGLIISFFVSSVIYGKRGLQEGR